MTTRTTAKDEGIERPPRVNVQRHAYDFNDLAGDVVQQIITTIETNPAGCHYFNPAVTISCPEPTKAFFAIVRREQARWCRIASQTFRKRERRRVKSWISDAPILEKYGRYLDRAACFTGILFIGVHLVPYHSWPIPTPEKSETLRE